MESTHGTNSILPRHDEEDGAFPVEVQSQVIGVSPVESRSDLMNHKRGFHKHAKFDLMLQYLRQQQLEKHWADHDTTEGVILKRGRDDYICQPSKLPKHINGFFDEARRLNVKVAMTVKSSVIQTFLQSYKDSHVPFSNGQQLQIVQSLNMLSSCKRYHYAAFIRNVGILVVWDEDPTKIIHRAEKIERYLIDMLWEMQVPDDASLSSAGRDDPDGVKSEDDKIEDEKNTANIKARPILNAVRRTRIYQSFLVALAAILTIFCLSVGWRAIAVEIIIDGSYTRLAILAATPFNMWLGWFFFMTIITGIAQIAGPIHQLKDNSKFYSAVKSRRLTDNLPHVTIQCPVYKEGLDTVIHPTIRSLQKAMSTYELQGGSANIFINDDGIQLLPEDEVRRRAYFYEDNNIGWIGRPRHAPKGDENGQNVFVRAGKFKKASNMNYCLQISTRVEDIISSVARGPDWTQDDEDFIYNQAFQKVLQEDAGRTWGAGDIRVGDYVLLIDSDTRVPEDCLLDAVSEMEHSPEVAIIQFSSGVMNVTTTFFERAITFFTNLIYTAIRFAVANGDVAPFVGHNAILRWSAIQHVRYFQDNIEKYWAENTVSEDFDMALRLQGLGYTLRFSTYYDNEFKEGVSLTVYDELARWEKYAYGCAELLFQPFRYWIVRGPVTPLFRRFMRSPMSLRAKITIMSYIGTYFAIASAWPLTLMNYFLVGWFNGHLDHAYVDSFKIYFGIVVVFQGLGTISLAVLRYRVEGRSLLGSLAENLTWILLLTVFLGGISLHVSQAILCYLFSIDMTWGATAKEAQSTSFFREVPTILRKFKFTFCFCIVLIAGMIAMAGIGPLGNLVPYDWRITTFVAIYPLATLVVFHFLLPLVLNPGLMQFTF